MFTIAQLATVSVPLLAMPPALPLAMVSPERLVTAATLMIGKPNETPAAGSTVRLLAPGPWMAMLLVRYGSELCRSMVPVTAKPIVNLSDGLPASAARMAARRVPGPASASELTVRLTCAGTARSSRASTRGRKRGAAGRL